MLMMCQSQSATVNQSEIDFFVATERKNSHLVVLICNIEMKPANCNGKRNVLYQTIETQQNGYKELKIVEHQYITRKQN